MLKLNLNELRNYKVIVFKKEEIDMKYNENNYFIYYFGLIENIYVKDGELIFQIYGDMDPFFELEHLELKIRILDIYNYEKKYDSDYYDNYLYYNESYEYINIKTSFEIVFPETKVHVNITCRLFKTTDFPFLASNMKDIIDNIFDLNRIAYNISRDKFISGLFYNMEDFISEYIEYKMELDFEQEIIMRERFEREVIWSEINEEIDEQIESDIEIDEEYTEEKINYYKKQKFEEFFYPNSFDDDVDCKKEDVDYMCLDYKEKNDYGYLDDDNPDYEYLSYEAPNYEDYYYDEYLLNEDFYYQDFD